MKALKPPTSPARRKQLTPLQRWRLRRDLVIYLANKHGASHRLLADVFDLPHSRVFEVVRKLREQYEGTPCPAPPPAPRP